MSEFVQSFDPNSGLYVKFHVKSAEMVEQSHRPFPDVDEVEPLERRRPVRVPQSDPLAMYR